MILKFNNTLNRVDNKLLLIEQEIANINYFLISLESANNLNYYYFFDKTNPIIEIKSEYESKEFLDNYSKLLIDKEVDLNRYKPDDIWNNDVEYSLAVDFFKYNKKLYQIKEEYSNNSKPIKKQSFSHKQTMLILHYLGLDLRELENSNVAPILSKIINFSEQNTREYLSYIRTGTNEVRTKQNLTQVAKLFEFHNLTDISNKIKKEIEDLKK